MIRKYINNIIILQWVITSVLLFICCYQTSLAATYELPYKGDLIGEIQNAKAKSGETLLDIGRRYGAGKNEIITANPAISPTKRLPRGTEVLIPAQYILPAAPRTGIVINLAEMRLYYYPPSENIVITEPVGIGLDSDKQWFTPTGVTEVIEKKKHPSWYPPLNVKEEALRKGNHIPDRFPPGRDNPLGSHMLRLGWRTYLIHGTNRPEGVGSRVSAGCLRMYPESIKQLYKLVPVGTQVRIINQPFKAGWLNGHLYLEAHAPLQEDQLKYDRDYTALSEIISHKITDSTQSIKWKTVKKAADNLSGIPIAIG